MIDKQSIKTGFSFGLTSGIITTLGLIVGLHSGTHSKEAVIAGVFTIAIADALSDALGIHISEETREGHKDSEIWESTAATFLTKFIIALSFLIPLTTLPLSSAICASIIWGFLLVIIFNFYLAKLHKEKPLKIIFEHLIITVAVIFIAHFVGDWVAMIR